MSSDKFAKHQKSSKTKWVITDANGDVVVKANSEEEFLIKRSEYLREQRIEHKEMKEIK